MELAVLLPIAAFIAMAAGLVVVFRGTGRIVARSRELANFQRAVKDLAARIDGSLGGVVGQIDAVRRHQIAPGAIHDAIATATDAVQGYTDEARALGGSRQMKIIGTDLVGDLERAARALAMAEHGAAIMVTSRGPRELEAETSLKRGYLNLLHAREAIARHAVEAGKLSIDESRRRSVGRRA